MGNRANFLPPAEQEKPKKTNTKITRIALVIDRSGSMDKFRTTLPEQLKKQFETITKQEEGFVRVSLQDFDYPDNIVWHFKDKTPKEAQNFNYYYGPNGSTALNDAVKEAIKFLETTENNDAAETDDWGYLVVILTDGQENCSRTSGAELERLISQKQNTGHWTFAFMVPKGNEDYISSRLNVHRSNVTGWDQTQKGFENVQAANMLGTSNYMMERSAGTKAVSTYFRTDLTGFDPVKDKLLDVTSNFKKHAVEKETDITSFYQYKMGLPYNPAEGKCFYQLTKKELVQPHKQILVRHKINKNIYGGDVRKALKMAPATNGVNVKVEPGNHMEYDIFVQSTSPNRKLVRGSDVLIRK